jgi:hypothetical protein
VTISEGWKDYENEGYENKSDNSGIPISCALSAGNWLC